MYLAKYIKENKEGLIVACLYIMSDGNLHADSWIRYEGWEMEDPCKEV